MHMGGTIDIALKIVSMKYRQHLGLKEEHCHDQMVKREEKDRKRMSRNGREFCIVCDTVV